MQYVLSSQNGGDDICIKYEGSSMDITVGQTISFYGYCINPQDYYTQSGEQKNGIVIRAFHAKFVS